MKTTIYLVRHGITDWNEAGRYQGSSDIELNEKGIEEAIEAGKLLSTVPFNKIYSSPLARAKRTAEEIAKHHGLPVHLVDELKERSYGDYEGMTFDEIERQPYFQKHLRKNWYLQGAPNGESFEESSARVGKALSEIVSKHVNETIAIVAHGGVIKGIGHHIGHFEKEHVAKIIIPNARPLQVEYLHSEKRYNVLDFPAASRK
jgi:broad specificity phosphatase PhoE